MSQIVYRNIDFEEAVKSADYVVLASYSHSDNSRTDVETFTVERIMSSTNKNNIIKGQSISVVMAGAKEWSFAMKIAEQGQARRSPLVNRYSEKPPPLKKKESYFLLLTEGPGDYLQYSAEGGRLLANQEKKVISLFAKNAQAKTDFHLEWQEKTLDTEVDPRSVVFEYDAVAKELRDIDFRLVASDSDWKNMSAKSSTARAELFVDPNLRILELQSCIDRIAQHGHYKRILITLRAPLK